MVTSLAIIAMIALGKLKKLPATTQHNYSWDEVATA